MRVGVIDVGTNSVRVLVADGLRALERDLVMTRLGEGVDRARVLGAEPLRRTVDAIADYASRCRAADVAAIRVIATSAVRDAANRAEFLDAVWARAGVRADVLTGEDEAHLAFAGATQALTSPGPYVVADIGGGSTELVWGSTRAERWVSMDIGSVRLTERHIRSDPPTQSDCAAVRADARAVIVQDARAVMGGEAMPMFIGVAGTITTVAAMSLGLEGYDRDAIHHAILSREDIETVRARLTAMTSAERALLPAMPRGREDVIVGGVLILEEIMGAMGARTCLVSESDILDGAAAELFAAEIP